MVSLRNTVTKSWSHWFVRAGTYTAFVGFMLLLFTASFRGKKISVHVADMSDKDTLDQEFEKVIQRYRDTLDQETEKVIQLFENAADVICSIDVDGKFVAVSPAAYNTWNYQPEELIGRRFIELVLPADHQETIRAVRAVRAERGTMNFENRTRRKDGTLVTILWSAFWSESQRSLFCVAHDITQRKICEQTIKASERKVRQVIDSMPVGLITMTQDGIIEGLNPASEKLFGYAAEELCGQHIMTILPATVSADNAQDRLNFMGSVLKQWACPEVS